ncbi:hypothetical protein POTOM_019703 [Populus tomentosa]|uniref:Alginate lyase 2 domain-containing protein n=1 Tax=Populus tomentosa TaxID=118781 RepID=A0A8X8D3E3_POPTO|nr:hypothetical protein POTOM_019703 [Populus tomentosa]
MERSYSLLLLFLALFSLKSFNLLCSAADPTDGFTPVPLTEANFVLQKPYNGLDCSSGVWQFEGYGFVPNGTSSVTVAQIHGAFHGATTLILRIYDGNMRYYSGDLVATDPYDKWFRLNIIHDVDGGRLTVFIDGEERYSTHDQGPGDLYFKCGV